MDWEHDCAEHLATAATHILTPSQLGIDPLNPYRNDPSIEQVPLQVQFELYHDGDWYDQTKFILPDSLKGKEKAGLEISTMQVVLQDIDEPSRLAFSRGAYEGQRVRLRNGNGTDWYFKGEVESVKPTAIHQYSDFSDRRRILITCTNELALFRRVPIEAIYTDDTPTEGAMLLDLCARYVPELDASGINVDLGQEITRKTLAGPYLFEVFKEALQGNPNTAFYLDISQEPSKIYWDKKDELSVLLPIELTDETLYQYCKPGQFHINPWGKGYRNSVMVQAPLLYNAGTVDVDLDNDIVYGDTDTEFYNRVKPGNTFRLPSSDSSYTVDKNNTLSDNSVREFTLASPYREATATGVQYEIIGESYTWLEEDSNEVERRAQLRGESGEFAGLVRVTLDISTPLTEEEIQRLAEVSLRLNGYDGYLNTNNRLFAVANLRAGRTLRLSMPLRYVQDEVPIQEVDWHIRNSSAPPRSGRDDPKIDYKISFTDRAQLTENIFLQLLLSQRRIKIRDSATLTIHKNIGERWILGDCVVASEGEESDEEFTYSDSVQADELTETTGPWYAMPVDPGQLPIIAIDLDDASTYWHAT